MSKGSSYFYSRKKLEELQNRGVIIHDLNSVKIGREVSLEKISSGSIIYPFVRINGEKTKINSGSQIGNFGAVNLHDSWIGKNVIVGSLGPVTLKDVVVGPESILGSGVAENSVFLGKESKVNKFTTGFGFSIREGSLYEEDSSSAQHTDTKMTILFPWATLGSNINFCDTILAGGTGSGMGSFSEVGSGTIHYNYTIRGDKATASLFGDVNKGVFLDRERIFIGGNNSLIGPLKSDFGVMTSAHARLTGTLSSGLNFGSSLPSGIISYDPKIFLGVFEIVSKQLNFLAELAALYNWYKQIRISCIAKTSDKKFIYSAGLKIVELNFKERHSQLNKFLERVQSSLSRNEKSKKISEKEIKERRKLLEKWPVIDQRLANLNDFEVSAPESLVNRIFQLLSDSELNYTKVIKKLSKEEKKTGEKWLNGISKKVKEVLI
tara:strand:- start:964 stop:2271 length:1308 start_codon:yes stop_codon:yes gene_type:complete